MVIFYPKGYPCFFGRLDSGREACPKDHGSRDCPRVKTAFLLVGNYCSKVTTLLDDVREFNESLKLKMLNEILKKFRCQEKNGGKKNKYFLRNISQPLRNFTRYMDNGRHRRHHPENYFI